MSGKYIKLWEWAKRFAPDNEYLAFDNVIECGVEKALGLQGLDKSTFLDRSLRNLWVHFSKKNNELKRNGCTPIFEVVEKESRYIRWKCPRNIGGTGNLLHARPWILTNIDALDDRSFEYVGAAAISFEGADYWVSPRRGDENVDFCIRFQRPFTSHIFGCVSNEIRIIGQCKKYRRPVSVEKMRELSETLNEVRQMNARVRKMLPTWFMASRGPIAAWFISHQGFQSAAMTKARNQGIIISDSFSLSEAVSLMKEIGDQRTPVNRANVFNQRVKEMRV